MTQTHTIQIEASDCEPGTVVFTVQRCGTTIVTKLDGDALRQFGQQFAQACITAMGDGAAAGIREAIEYQQRQSGADGT